MQRIRFEDRPGGGRVMRLGTEHPGVGTIWDGLEDVKLTSRGLNTSARPDAVRAPMVTGLRRSESGGRSIVSVAPSRSRAASTVRQDDPVKRALMHLDRAMRDQPDRLYSAVRTIQRLLEAEKVPENIGRLRLALGRSQTQLEERARQRQVVLARLQEQPTFFLLTEATQLMRDLDVTAEEREVVRVARVRHDQEQAALRREQEERRAAQREKEWREQTEQQLAEERERNEAARRERVERALAVQLEQEETAERQAQRERAEKLGYLAPFVMGALKKAAREERVTTWREDRAA
ncbi:hypothetical protein OHB49_42470 (plasmid) [Streptomyces sp. NBC_01717]|uniref:hypothetical protein n=1 Tax=Streptomyces sp. NBC_01717 TaxID=2975918 RepID=UPI002E3204CE|nr:hypothetical protein [Streptomyces sp. NBC_01717]